MNVFLSAFSVLTTALRRMATNVGLVLCALAATITAVALAVSIPVYAEGASLRLLQDELVRAEQRTNRSAFALLIRYIGSQNGALEWERVKPADDYIAGPGLQSLRLPLDSLGRHARTDQFRLFLPPSSSAENQFVKNAALGFVSGLDAQMRIVDGAVPGPPAGPIGQGTTPAATPVEVMISRALADEIGANVGDQFRLVPTGARPIPIPIVVAAIWEAVNPRDPAWFYQPDAFKDIILVPEATFTGPLAAVLSREVSQIVWFARLSGAGLTAAEAAPLLARIDGLQAQAAGLLPGLRVEQGPTEPLTRYRQGVQALTTQLFVFSVPILALVLYFAALVAALLVARQRNEIALLKTRGVRDAQILGIYLVEWLVIGGLALAIGPWLGLAFAQVMGNTRSFLQLAEDPAPLSLALTAGTLSYGVAAVALALAAALVPAFVATRRTLVDVQQQAARALRPPFWQRAYLDLLLLIPAGYGIYQLRAGGALPLGASSSADPFSNPLLVLLPVLFSFALGLLAMRLLPLILEGLARLAARPAWIVPLVVFRNLARQPGAYRGPLLLLMLTLSLATFGASMAATLDRALVRQITYAIGAPAQLIESGETAQQQPPGVPGRPPQPPGAPGGNPDEPRFLFVPVSDHLSVPGITAATRVGAYDEAVAQLGGPPARIQLVGIDRLDFPKVVTQFDPAWADAQPLGALMNTLALRPEHVLVSEELLGRGVKVGDTLPVQLTIAGDQREVSFRIAGTFRLWPGFYTQDGPIVVANLDYIFDQMGAQYPYDVWIERDPQADLDGIAAGVRGLGVVLIDVRDAATLIRDAQIEPRRQGLFGLLTVGFVAAGALTLLGFVLAALIAARRRTIELGMLGALGLSRLQVVSILTIEQALLVVAGLGVGTAIGLGVSQLVVPLMQVGSGPRATTPPTPPQIAWGEVSYIYLVFGAALVVTVLALAYALGRLRLFEAVKLGDAN